MKRKIKLKKSSVIIFVFLIFILIGCGKTKENSAVENNTIDKTSNSTLEKLEGEKKTYIEFDEKVFLKGMKETPNSYSVNYYPSGRVKNIVYNSNLYEVEDKSLLSLIKGLQSDINVLIDKDLEYATQTYEVIPAYIIAEKLNKNIDENDKNTLKDLEEQSENTVNKLYEKLKVENSQIIEKIEEKIKKQTEVLELLNSQGIVSKGELTLKDEVTKNNNQEIKPSSNGVSEIKEPLQSTLNMEVAKDKLESTTQKKVKEKATTKTPINKVKCNIYYDGVERDQMVLKNGQKVFVNSDGCIN